MFCVAQGLKQLRSTPCVIFCAHLFLESSCFFVRQPAETNISVEHTVHHPPSVLVVQLGVGLSNITMPMPLLSVSVSISTSISLSTSKSPRDQTKTSVNQAQGREQSRMWPSIALIGSAAWKRLSTARPPKVRQRTGEHGAIEYSWLLHYNMYLSTTRDSVL